MRQQVGIGFALADQLHLTITANQDGGSARLTIVLIHLFQCVPAHIQKSDHIPRLHSSGKHAIIRQPAIALAVVIDIAAVAQRAAKFVGCIGGA